MECLFCVFLGHDMVHHSFHLQVLPSIIVINRGCWCRSVCFRTSSRTYPQVLSGCVFEILTLCALSPPHTCAVRMYVVRSRRAQIRKSLMCESEAARRTFRLQPDTGITTICSIHLRQRRGFYGAFPLSLCTAP